MFYSLCDLRDLPACVFVYLSHASLKPVRDSLHFRPGVPFRNIANSVLKKADATSHTKFGIFENRTGECVHLQANTDRCIRTFWKRGTGNTVLNPTEARLSMLFHHITPREQRRGMDSADTRGQLWSSAAVEMQDVSEGRISIMTVLPFPILSLSSHCLRTT